MTVRDVETQRGGIKCTIDMIPLRAGGGVGVGGVSGGGNNRFSNHNNENRNDESNRNSGSSGNNGNSGNRNGMKKNSNNRNHKINDIPLSSSRVIISDYTYGSQQHISSHYQQQQQQQQNIDSNNNSTSSSSTKKKIANGCSFFSLIGMLFMIFVGILMETQPFYIKGVTPNQIVNVDSSTSNNRAAVLRSLGQWQDDDDSMDNVTTTNNNNKWLSSMYNVIRSIQSSTIWQRYYHHRRIRIISSTAPSSTYSSTSYSSTSYSSTSYTSTSAQQQEEEERYLNNNDDNNNDDDDFEYETTIYQMQQEAKTAFKTAALYFLTMVLTYIYAQNHERITVAQSSDSMCDVDGIVNEGRGCCHRLSLALRAGLRRRKYSDIPDDDVLFQPARSSVSSSSSRGIFDDPLSSTSEVGNCERLPFLISGVTDGIDSFADEGVVGGAREARFRSLSLPSSDSSGITSSPRGAGREHQWADQYKSKRR